MKLSTGFMGALTWAEKEEGRDTAYPEREYAVKETGQMLNLIDSGEGLDKRMGKVFRDLSCLFAKGICMKDSEGRKRDYQT
jgi:hypothetical protein